MPGELVDVRRVAQAFKIGSATGPVNASSVHVGAVDPVADLDAVLLAPGPRDDHLQVVVGNGGLERPEEPLRARSDRTSRSMLMIVSAVCTRVLIRTRMARSPVSAPLVVDPLATCQSAHKVGSSRPGRCSPFFARTPGFAPIPC